MPAQVRLGLNFDRCVGPLAFFAQPKHNIGACDLLLGALDPDRFNLIVAAIAKSSSINKNNGHAAQGNWSLNHITRGACNRRSNGSRIVHKSVEK